MSAELSKVFYGPSVWFSSVLGLIIHPELWRGCKKCVPSSFEATKLRDEFLLATKTIWDEVIIVHLHGTRKMNATPSSWIFSESSYVL